MLKKKSKSAFLAQFLYEVGTLRKVPRAHMQTLLTNDLSDNIASHSYRVSVIGWFLAYLEKADPYKVVTMCLFHDSAESRSGDQNWVHKSYVKVFEDEIIKDQLSNLPNKNELSKVVNEYRERLTKEALIAKDADLIDQIILLKEYSHQGNKESLDWLGNNKGKGNMQYKLLKTRSAKLVAMEILKQDPSDWWSKNWTEKRR